MVGRIARREGVNLGGVTLEERRPKKRRYGTAIRRQLGMADDEHGGKCNAAKGAHRQPIEGKQQTRKGEIWVWRLLTGGFSSS